MSLRFIIFCRAVLAGAGRRHQLQVVDDDQAELAALARQSSRAGARSPHGPVRVRGDRGRHRGAARAHPGRRRRDPGPGRLGAERLGAHVITESPRQIAWLRDSTSGDAGGRLTVIALTAPGAASVHTAITTADKTRAMRSPIGTNPARRIACRAQSATRR